MRYLKAGETLHDLDEAGLSLGVACPLCKHRAILDLSRSAMRNQPILDFTFQCSTENCETDKLHRYAVAPAEVRAFYEGADPPEPEHHRSWLHWGKD